MLGTYKQQTLLCALAIFPWITIAMEGPAYGKDPNELEIKSVDKALHAPPYAEESYRKLRESGKAGAIFDRPSNFSQKELYSKEFYTFFKINNFLNDDLIISRCGSNGDKWYVAINMRVDYQGSKGSQAVSFIPDTPIIVDGNNQDAAKGIVSRGCTFKSLNLKQNGPYLLYTGFDQGQGEYTLHFNVSVGSTKDPLGLSMFTKLALAAGGSLPGLVIPAGFGNAAGQLSATLDTVIDRASSFALNVQYSAVLVVDRKLGADEVSAYQQYKPWQQVTGSYLKIGSPILDVKNEVAEATDTGSSKCKSEVFERFPGVRTPDGSAQYANGACVGYIEIFQGRSASIVWDASSTDAITADDILLNPGLGLPHNCIIGASSCGKDASTFLKTVGAAAILDVGGDLVSTAPGSKEKPSGVDNWAKVFTACQKIRQSATELALSPIDALLVRSALLQKTGFLTKLQQYANWNRANPRPLRGQNKPDATTAATNTTPADPVANEYAAAIRDVKLSVNDDPFKQCWSLDDAKKLAALKEIMLPKVLHIEPGEH
jgi:hypothetical protein